VCTPEQGEFEYRTLELVERDPAAVDRAPMPIKLGEQLFDVVFGKVREEVCARPGESARVTG
jgi:hypothetical protein